MSILPWFDSWSSLAQILVSAVCCYGMVILFIRLSGKRATSRMNNFDWIVTVSLGSLLASTVVSKDVTIADGAVAMGFLLCLQGLLTYFTARFSWARSLVRSTPRLLYAEGEFRHATMKAERISSEEIEAAIRGTGTGTRTGVCAVILEPDATLSVIPRNEAGAYDLLAKVEGWNKKM